MAQSRLLDSNDPQIDFPSDGGGIDINNVEIEFSHIIVVDDQFLNLEVMKNRLKELDLFDCSHFC